MRWGDKGFRAHQHLIGLRHPNPSPELIDNASQYSELLYSWCVAGLAEFNISVEDDVFALVTDGGSDIKCCAIKFLGKQWECVGLCGCVLLCVRACPRAGLHQ